MTSKIKILLLFICLQFLSPQISFSQTRDTLLEKLVNENDIQTRECYHTLILEGKKSPLSLLTSKMSFDSLGRPTNYTIYEDSVQIKSFLVYFYDEKGNLIKSELREKGKYNNQTVIHSYNEHDLRVLETASSKGKKFVEMHYLYNENNLLQKQEVEFTKPPSKGSRRQSISYKYNQENQLIQTIHKTDINGLFENELDSKGNPIATYYFKSKKKPGVLYSEMKYDEHNQLIQSKTYENRSRSIFDGVNHIPVEKGDVTVWLKEYYETGLLASEQFLLNDVLISFREYEYLKGGTN